MSAADASRGTELVRLERLDPAGQCRRRVLFVTNMWPDEKRPYYGSFIHSQAKSLSAGEVLVDVIYVRGFLGNQAYLRSLREIPRLARAGTYDLVHVHYGHTAVASVGLRQRPLVVSFCGEDLLGAPREDGITRKSRLEVAVFRQAARLATVTITKSAEMEAVLPPSVRARNHVLPNGVDLEMFSPRGQAEARAELGWEQEGKVMLFLGNPEDPRKNVALAEAAAARVGELVPGARLHKAWGVEPQLVPVLMNAADCLLFPSKSEGSPNAVKEAMACALPIVAAPVGDVAERLQGVASCFVRPHDPDAFAEAAEQALAAGRAPAAREAVESLGIARVAGRLGEIYDEALARQGRR